MTAATVVGAARIAAVLGHELRNPLAAALANAAVVAEMTDPDDPRRPLLAAVLGELERLAGLLDGYLAFARTARPRQQLVGIEQLAQRVAARGGVAVRIVAAGEVPVVGDAVLLECALQNLVDNALQAGAGAVTLRAQLRGAVAVVEIEDDGPGVPADLRERIFDAGFSRRGGSGLGLCIVAETIAAHGGAVRCDGAACGSRFVIELPAAPALASA